MPTRQRCKTHRAPAGWTCTGCQSTLCPVCVAEQGVGTHTTVTACCLCGELARPIRVRRAEVSFASRLPGALTYPLNGSGAIALLAAGVVLWGLGWFGHLGSVISAGLVWAYVFSLTQKTALGSSDIGPPDLTHIFDVFRAAIRGWLTGATLLPAILYFALAHGCGMPSPETPLLEAEAQVQEQLDELHALQEGKLPTAEEEPSEWADAPDENVTPEAPAPERPPSMLATPDARAPERPASTLAEGPFRGIVRALKDPILWILVVLGLLWMPMALLMAATDTSILTVLNPVAAFRCIVQLGGDYLVLIVALVGLGVLQGVIGLLGMLVQAIPFPIVPGVVAAAKGMYVPVVTARVLGLLLYVRGAELGYLPPDDELEPADPSMQPRGTLVRATPVAPPPGDAQRPRAISIEDACVEAPPPGPPPPTPEQRIAAAQERLDAAQQRLTAAADTTSAQSVAAAAAAGDWPRALELYRSAESLDPKALAADVHFQLGKAAAGQRDFALAVRALKAAASVSPQGPVAPAALVIMGRIYGEHLRDETSAQKLWRLVLERYPNTEAARFAQSRVRR